MPGQAGGKDKGNATLRCFRIMEALAGHALNGLANKQLAETLRVSPVDVSRSMTLLESLGYARRNESGRWVLTTKIVGISERVRADYENVLLHVAERRRNIEAAAARIGG